jgi:hypothetical protein
MAFSNEQKLIITLLTDIHAALGIKNSVDPIFVQRMVQGGDDWALKWAYDGLFEGVQNPPEVEFVVQVLTMWEAIEYRYLGLDGDEREQLEQLSPVFGREPSFRGFDGNNEAELRSIVHILVDDLKRWQHFAGRDTNSHVQSSDGYRRMLEVYDRIIGTSYEFRPSIEEFAELLNARIHPDNRNA